MSQKNAKKSSRRKYHNVTSLENITTFGKNNLIEQQQQ